MKKTVLIILILIAILIISGCTYQSPAATTAEATAQETEKTTALAATITPAPVFTTAPSATTSSIATTPTSTETSNAQTTFTLTKADFEKLKAPLTVLAIENEYNYKFNYDLKNGIPRENVADYASTVAYYFNYFYPEIEDSHIYERDNVRYGIKKGDLYIDGGMHIPQKAINSILLSTFGEDALKGIDLNKSIFDETESEPYDELKDGIYTTVLYESYPEEDVLGPLDLPISGNEDTEFKTSYKVTYGDAGHEAYNYSIVFKLKKDDTSEWGYNITAFNMQEVK